MKSENQDSRVEEPKGNQQLRDFNPLPKGLFLEKQFRKLSLAARYLLMAAHQYADDQESDGFLDHDDIEDLARLSRLTSETSDLVVELVTAGYLHPTTAGFEVVGFRGLSHEVREQHRAYEREKKRRQRSRPMPPEPPSPNGQVPQQDYQISRGDNREESPEESRDKRRGEESKREEKEQSKAMRVGAGARVATGLSGQDVDDKLGVEKNSEPEEEGMRVVAGVSDNPGVVGNPGDAGATYDMAQLVDVIVSTCQEWQIACTRSQAEKLADLGGPFNDIDVIATMQEVRQRGQAISSAAYFLGAVKDARLRQDAYNFAMWTCPGCGSEEVETYGTGEGYNKCGDCGHQWDRQGVRG